MKVKDAIGKDVYAIKFADYGIKLVCSGLVANTDYVKANPDLVRRMMVASITQSVSSATCRGFSCWVVPLAGDMAYSPTNFRAEAQRSLSERWWPVSMSTVTLMPVRSGGASLGICTASRTG